MKTRYWIVFFTLLFAASTWVFDALIDALFFYEDPFLDLLLFNVPSHQLFVRIFILVVIAISGAVVYFLIRQRDQSNEQLGEQRRMLTALMDNLPGMAYRCACDEHWTMQFVSDGVVELTGYSRRDLIENKTISYNDIIDSADREMVKLKIAAALRNHEPFEMQYRINAKSGERRWVWERGIAVRGQDGRVERLEGFITDISREVNLRTELIYQLNQNELIRQNAIDGFCRIDRNGVIQDVNAGLISLLRHSKSALIGRPFHSICQPQHTPDIQSILQQARQAGWTRFDMLLAPKTGAPAEVDVNLVFCRDVKETFYFAVIRDMTGRKETERRLAESEERYRLLFSNLKVGLAFCRIAYNEAAESEDFIVLQANQTFHYICGGDSENVSGLYGSEIFSRGGENAQRWAASLARRAKQKRDVAEERFEQSSRRWLAVNAYPVDDEHFTLLIDDVTDHKFADQKMRELNNTLTAVIQSSPLPIITVDREMKVTTWNSSAEEVFGWKASEVIGKTYPIIPEHQMGEFPAYFQRLLKDPYIEHETQRRHKDGRLIDIAVTTAPMYGAQGELTGIIAILTDISHKKAYETEKEHLEQQLRQSQKMEAVGQLAGGVAHDFNNLLMVIQGYSEIGLIHASGEGEACHDFEEILKAAERAGAITRQLLAFSRKQAVQTRRLNLNLLIEECSKMLFRLIGENIHIETRLEPHLHDIEADVSQIEQVLINLAVNARDAMPEGGNLSIETRNITVDSSHAEALGCGEGEYVMLRVSDDGIGMAKDVSERIFEPFFTTKDLGRGTGLGLSTVYGIVRQCQGGIDVESLPGHGAVFTVYLPSCRVDPLDESDEKEINDIRPGTETILLAEDAEAVRNLMNRVLSDHGYTVHVAHDGAEAVGRAAQLDYCFDLVISDIVMPRMNGIEALAEIRRHAPGVKMILMTGYADRQDVMPDELDIPIIHKPFSPIQLLECVRSTLDAREVTSGRRR